MKRGTDQTMHVSIETAGEGWGTTLRHHLQALKAQLQANRKLVAVDAFSIVVACPVALLLSAGPHFGFSEIAALPRLIPLVLLVTMPVFVCGGFYRRHTRSSSVQDLPILIPGTAVALLLALTVEKATDLVPEAPLTTWPILFLALMPMLGGGRLLARHREILRRGDALGSREPVLLVGTDAAADLFLRAMRQPGARYEVIGIIDSSSASTNLLFHSVPILGAARDPGPVIARLTAANRLPRQIFLSGPVTHFDREGMAVLLNWAEGRGIRVRSLPDLTQPDQGTARNAPGLRDIDPEDVLTRPQTRVERQLLALTYQGRRVLVTGAGGSIGSEMVRQLASLKPAELVLIDSCELNAYQIDRSLARHFPDIPRHLHICCIRDRARLDAIFAQHRPELVFNAAALKHVPLVEQNPAEGVLTNVIGSRNVCDAARAVGALAVVQVSTDKAVNTTNVMGATKRVAEFYCQAQDLITREIGCDTRYFAVRFGNVLGSSGSLVPLFQEQIARGGPLTVTDPRMERYFMTIREAVELTLVSAAHGLRNPNENGRIFVLDMGKPIRIVDLAERMIRMAGKEPGRDIRIDFVGIRPGEKLFEELFDRSEVVRPAGFAGVNCAVPTPVPISRLRAAMLKLEQAARAGDEAALRDLLASLVPGYRPGAPETEAGAEDAADQPARVA